MQVTNIRQKLHQYIDNSDEKLLKLMYAIAKEYYDDDDFEYSFTEEEIKDFEKRRTDRVNGKSKVYNWTEAKDKIIGKK
ncbi:hypothetical protein [Pinibacter aurantiacus]|uniref:Addiction module protein n=1 Tax=Pinibacter aurantiacus TaxID=2851599 RepID=A0A9E2SE61_9BACT|nr:hypothetical protein [Pinibacter aurantiacus]MBV4359827.1 hypothetical protein [Pinibacter aurantiacus]